MPTSKPDAADDTSAGRGVSSIERAVDVLTSFADAGGPLGVTDLANSLGISKAAVHRTLTSLRDRDLVGVDEGSRQYRLGPGVLKLAAAYREQLDIRTEALAVMRDLVDATNETATFSVRSGSQRVYVDQLTPAREVKMTVQVGASFPLHAGSSSKAFLAWLPEEERDEYLSGDLAALTETTIVDRQELARELGRIRQQGFAVSMGERQHGAASVAAPILDEHGQPIAAISICGPQERFQSEVATAASLLVEATRRLSSLTGYAVEA
jgi:DNA-binding IclR family transcriptional regulator